MVNLIKKIQDKYNELYDLVDEDYYGRNRYLDWIYDRIFPDSYKEYRHEEWQEFMEEQGYGSYIGRR